MTSLGELLRGRGLANREIRRLCQTGRIRYHGLPIADLARPVDDVAIVEGPNLVPGRDLALLYRDPSLVIAFKPSGLLSVPARGRRERSATSTVANITGSAFAVHRLDEDTSGLLAVALTEPAQRKIKADLEHHKVERRYLAIAAGRIRDARTIDAPLVRNRGDGRRGVAEDDEEPEGSKAAVTHIQPIGEVRGATILMVRLETGRTHQIRIHLSSIGHPVLGDRLYGSGAGRAPRLCLHAGHLSLHSPTGRGQIVVECPVPDDLAALIRADGEGGPPPRWPSGCPSY